MQLRRKVRSFNRNRYFGRIKWDHITDEKCNASAIALFFYKFNYGAFLNFEFKLIIKMKGVENFTLKHSNISNGKIRYYK